MEKFYVFVSVTVFSFLFYLRVYNSLPIERKKNDDLFTDLPVALGCYDNNNFFLPGQKISTNYDKSSKWCYGRYCSENGSIISWDDWNCNLFDAKTTPTLKSKSFNKTNFLIKMNMKK